MADMLSDSARIELKKLGFSDYEVRTYVALLQENPATAYQISKKANIPRANTYSVLEGLTQKNAVVSISQNPVRFVPVAPDKLFPLIAQETEKRCSLIADELSKLDTSDNTEVVWNLEGQDKIDDKIREFINAATKQVWLKADRLLVERYAKELKQATERGVKLLVILFGVDHDPFDFGEKASVLVHEGNGVRMSDADNLFTITIDFSTTLTSTVMGTPVATYTQSKPVVKLSESLIRHDVYMAEIFRKFGDQIDEEFGPHLYSLRKKFFSGGQMVKFSETMSNVPGWTDPAFDDPQPARRKVANDAKR